MRGIGENPQHELRVSSPFVDLGEAGALDASMLALSTIEAGSLSITNRMRHFTAFDKKWRFLKVFDRRIERYDLTPANQFVAFFVRYAIKRLREFMASMPRTEALEDYIPPFLRIIRRLNGVWSILSPSFRHAPLRELPLDNQLLQFDPRYHVVLNTYLACESL